MREREHHRNRHVVLTEVRSGLERMLRGLETILAVRRVAGFSEHSDLECKLFSLTELSASLPRTVGVVGEEGAGKLTLVNAILGEDLVPTDSNRPGTLAPISITERLPPNEPTWSSTRINLGLYRSQKKNSKDAFFRDLIPIIVDA